jgi:hypothetical protein
VTDPTARVFSAIAPPELCIGVQAKVVRQLGQ